jgi:hypothetical protein
MFVWPLNSQCNINKRWDSPPTTQRTGNFADECVVLEKELERHIPYCKGVPCEIMQEVMLPILKRSSRVQGNEFLDKVLF